MCLSAACSRSASGNGSVGHLWGICGVWVILIHVAARFHWDKYRIPSQVAADMFHLIFVSPHCAELCHEARHAVLMQKGIVSALLRLDGMSPQLEGT